MVMTHAEALWRLSLLHLKPHLILLSFKGKPIAGYMAFCADKLDRILNHHQTNIKESQDCVAAIQTEKMGSEILTPQWEDKQFATIGHSKQN